MDELIPYEKLYLVDTRNGARVAIWTPKYGNDFCTRNGDVIKFEDVEYIVELCDE